MFVTMFVRPLMTLGKAVKGSYQNSVACAVLNALLAVTIEVFFSRFAYR